MQGVYYRPSADHAWTLLGRTKGYAHAEELMRKHNRHNKVVGEFVYLEARALPDEVSNLRDIGYRLFDRRLAKSIDLSRKKMRKDARMVWVKRDPRQLKMF